MPSKILSLKNSKGLARIGFWVLIWLVTIPTNLFAQNVNPGAIEENLKLSMSASSAYQFKSGLSGGGDVSVSRYGLAIGGTKPISEKVGLGVRMSYELDDYNFSSANGLSATNPWGNINRLGLGVRLTYKVTDLWNISGGPMIQSSGEDGANFSDSLLYGGMVSAMYRVTRDFTVGFGAGAFYRFEEIKIFPYPLISWNITDRLHLGNSYRIGLAGPAGLELSYILDKNWQVAAGGGHHSLRFRLDRNGSIPDGIGENYNWPVYARLSRKFGKMLNLDLYGGAAFGGKMKLQDSNGNDINSVSYKAAPLMGFNLSTSF